ncbi:MAG: hypothetical protein V1899_01165 [Planctomycetota bacterium]
MRLRHVLLITTAIGACASLMLALDFYRRLKIAERVLYLSSQVPGADSILYFGPTYAIGLLALAFLFLALLLMLLTLLRDKSLTTQLEGLDQTTSMAPPPSATPITSVPPSPDHSENISPSSVSSPASPAMQSLAPAVVEIEVASCAASAQNTDTSVADVPDSSRIA